jgi:ribosomal protein L35AE/L33A
LVSPNPTIIKAGNELTISWLDPLNDYDLQENEHPFSGEDWSPVTTEPTIVGDEYIITNALSGASRFYRLVPSILFKAGETNRTIIVKVNGDLSHEPIEHFFVRLGNPANAELGNADGMVTILDDDPVPTLVVEKVDVIEGNAGTVEANFAVNLSAPSAEPVKVDFSTADGTASAPSDYVAASETITFAVGEISKLITVIVDGDTISELDETFFVNLSNASNAAIATAQGVGTIRNDDARPSLSIGDLAMTEGNSGTVNAVFTVSVLGASSGPITVSFATADATADAPDDYAATSGTLSFAPGETSKTILVKVNGDTLNELDEIFFVNLSNAANATITKAQGLATIRNDDTPPNLNVNDVVVIEGNSGTVNAVFTVSLLGASSQSITVNFATSDGTATDPSDYVTASGVLVFASGETSKTIFVKLNGDTLNELDETFFVNLNNAVNATIKKPQGVGTIRNDDTPPGLSISNATVTEGNNGTVEAVFSVNLSGASSRTITVDFAMADATATAPRDYVVTTGRLTFAPKETGQSIVVRVNGDNLNEPDETFLVNLSNAINAVIGQNHGTGTILNDDVNAAPTVNITQPTRSLFRIADIASTAASSDATSLLKRLRVPNRSEPETSTASITVSSRSSM